MRRSILLAVSALVLAACDAPTAPPGSGLLRNRPPSMQMPVFTGNYSYTGTVDGQPDIVVSGNLAISSQIGSQADARITLSFRRGGQMVAEIYTLIPAPASLATDGSISFAHAGELQSGNDSQPFTLTHQGKLVGNLITGTWTHTPPDGMASGTWAAQR